MTHKWDFKVFSYELVSFQQCIRELNSAWDLGRFMDGPTDEELPRTVKQFAPIWTEEREGVLVWGHGFGNLLTEPDANQVLQEERKK